MKKNIEIFFLLFLIFLMSIAAKPMIPSLHELNSLVGQDFESKRIKSFIEKYNFTKNPKSESSWGSRFGIFLVINNKNKVIVGIRPPSEGTNMPTYKGNLPKGLKPGDTIHIIKQKMGNPISVKRDSKAYYEMNYKNMTISTINGSLFEVWLLKPIKNLN